MAEESDSGFFRTPRQRIGLILGIGLFALIQLLAPPSGMTAAGWSVAAVAALMATWWVTEALPLPATALLPLVLLPTLGVMPIGDIAPAYANPLVFLFLGGFLIAATIERWDLHRRIALHTVRLMGERADRLVLGFMLATALLSMWISNTAAAMMMVTIGLAVARRSDRECGDFGTALMLGIAYGASIGGVATLIGTPPNAILAGIAYENLGLEIGFARWMLFGLPLAAIMLAIAWWLLTRVLYRLGGLSLTAGCEQLRRDRAALGPISPAEIRVSIVFSLVATGWLLRGLLAEWLPRQIDDVVIALAGAVALFVIPAGGGRQAPLLDWSTAARIPWDILLLFGGGFALAHAFVDSELSHWIASQLTGLSGMGLPLIIAGVALMVVFLTELTSNTATASVLLPVLAALALEMEVHPFALMVPAAVAASFAFMLPVATPPNAIAFGSRRITVTQMARAGLALNLIGTLILTALVLWLLPFALGVALDAPLE